VPRAADSTSPMRAPARRIFTTDPERGSTV
jgi:hypothetical protein